MQQDYILVVDDNQTNIAILTDTLKEQGFRVFTARDGRGAIEHLKTMTPNLILLDVVMPGLDGFETCRRIKAHPHTENIPIIFMTALEEPEQKVKAFHLGAVDYITKPFRPEEVLARVNIHLRLHHLNQDLEKRVSDRTNELSNALKKLQQQQIQLVQQEKMSSLGSLMAGVAHEINNPVGYINGNIQHALNYVDYFIEHLRLYQLGKNSEAIASHAEEIELEYLIEDLPRLLFSIKDGATRIKEISRSLRNFARSDDETKTPFNLHDGIESTLTILGHRLRAMEFRPAIQIVRCYGSLPEVVCFPGPINQVFMNLLCNAVDALDEAAIATSNYQALEENPQIIKITTEQQGNQVMVRLRDNGPGIPEAVKYRIFEHTFTTKPIGKGTGLGLPISRQIVVDRHGGNLSVNSELNQGTEFVVTLPLGQPDKH
ncbi:MAG: response regulator [Synechococcales bacterium]|nr:response regulator [Synechococcales bacterium]